jgi:hypothetical protein
MRIFAAIKKAGGLMQTAQGGSAAKTAERAG